MIAEPADIVGSPTAETFATIMTQRRSIRRLRSDVPDPDALTRIWEAARLAPAAYNRPPWHVVVIHERQAEFWQLVETAFRERLEPDRLPRYLDRLQGFRTGIATIHVYEDRSVIDEMRETWQLCAERSTAFSAQAMGMVQLSLWLAIVAEGMATSIQHWEPLIEDRLAEFLDLSVERYRLVATMPFGQAAEEPRPVERPGMADVISLEVFAGGQWGDARPNR